MIAVTQSESTVLPLFIQSAKLNAGAPYNELRAHFRKHTRPRFLFAPQNINLDEKND